MNKYKYISPMMMRILEFDGCMEIDEFGYESKPFRLVYTYTKEGKENRAKVDNDLIQYFRDHGYYYRLESEPSYSNYRIIIYASRVYLMWVLYTYLQNSRPFKFMTDEERKGFKFVYNILATSQKN